MKTFRLLAPIAVLAMLSPVAGAATSRTGEQVVQYQCVLCHGPGIGGAPRNGRRKAWGDRSRAGLEALLRSALNGRGGMPPNGGLAELSESELRAAIEVMLRRSGAMQ